MIATGFPVEIASPPADRIEALRLFNPPDADSEGGESERRDALRRAIALEWGVQSMSGGDPLKYRRCALNVSYRLRYVGNADVEITPGEILARPDRSFRSMTGVGMLEQDVVRRNAEFDQFASHEKGRQAARTADLKSHSVCPKCGSHEVDQVDEKQIRAMDEGATFYFECLKCGNEFHVTA